MYKLNGKIRLYELIISFHISQSVNPWWYVCTNWMGVWGRDCWLVVRGALSDRFLLGSSASIHQSPFPIANMDRPSKNRFLHRLPNRFPLPVYPEASRAARVTLRHNLTASPWTCTSTLAANAMDDRVSSLPQATAITTTHHYICTTATSDGPGSLCHGMWPCTSVFPPAASYLAPVGVVTLETLDCFRIVSHKQKLIFTHLLTLGWLLFNDFFNVLLFVARIFI